jgi:hypothetical protein
VLQITALKESRSRYLLSGVLCRVLLDIRISYLNLQAIIIDAIINDSYMKNNYFCH